MEGRLEELEEGGREGTRARGKKDVPATGAILLLQGPDMDIDQPAHADDAKEFAQGLDTIENYRERRKRQDYMENMQKVRASVRPILHSSLPPSLPPSSFITYRCASVERWCRTAMQRAASKAFSRKGT